MSPRLTGRATRPVASFEKKDASDELVDDATPVRSGVR
jgi:hypothetical protein